MILASLRDMAERERLTEETAFEQKPVKWVISLDDEGRFLRVTDTLSDSLSQDSKKKPKQVAKVMSIPRRSGRTVQTQADFLVDKSEYVLGIEPDGKRAAAELEKRRSLFLEQMQAASVATGNVELQAAIRFLSSETERADCIAKLEEKGYASNDLFTFEVEDEMLHEHPDIRSYWSGKQDEVTGAAGNSVRQCVVCGEMCVPVEKHAALQIPGGVTSGVGLVTFNSAAFEKYALDRNANAPMCRNCMTAYVEALRRCLSDRYPRPDSPDEAFPKQSVRLTADTTAIFWAGAPSKVVEELAHLSDRPADVKAALESPWGGQQPGSLKVERFHCLILTGAQGRAIVRGLHTGTLGNLVEYLKAYFRCLAVPGRGDDKPMPLFVLLRSLAPAEKLDKLPSGLAGDIFLAAVVGMPLPRRVLAAAVARNVATQSVPRERAALLHLYFELQINTEKPPMSLDVKSTEPAYRLGRLLAVLEAVQYQAQGQINRNIINRFYGAASTRPGIVFPVLLGGVQHHLAKLPVASRRYWNGELEAVLSELIQFNPMLTLDEQGRFALGYYHQRQANFTRREKPSVNPASSTSETSSNEGEGQ